MLPMLILCCAAGAAPVTLTPLLPPEMGHWAEFALAGVEHGAANPFDPAEFAVDVLFSPKGAAEQRVPAFWMQPQRQSFEADHESIRPEGAAEWRVRWTPSAAGETACTVLVSRGGGEFTEAGRGAFTVGSAQNGAMPMARVEPVEKRYFQRADGAPLPLLGANVCWFGNRGTPDYDEWLAALADARMNFVRLWMAPFGFGIETLPDERLNYNQKRAWQLDYVLRLAEEKRLYVMLCMDFHGIFQDEPDMWGGNDFWPKHPYNTAQGGPCEKQNDFFTLGAAKDLYRKRLRYQVARWGACPALLSWQFFNEINNVYMKVSRKDVVPWHAEMAESLHAMDPWKHPITTSFGGSFEDRAMWELPGMDFAQFHLYLDGTGDGVTRQIGAVVGRFHERYEKPMFIGEYGVSFRGPGRDQDPHLRGLRQGLWAGLLAGSAGTAMPWWWDHLHPQNAWRLWTALNRFIEGTGLGGPGWKAVDAVAAGADGAEPPDLLVLGDDKTMLAYLVDPHRNYPHGALEEAPPEISANVTLPTRRPAGTLLRVEWWNPEKGEIIKSETVETGAPLMLLASPPFSVDIALRVLPVPSE
ncbi:MAG: glycoside hydrolase family 5 protein [Candidatus Hydrogenedens sp.]|nr:cellulase family glycosylhydrolase [Candidatus Hydrogenedentota bacterium]NLF56698.1 glycoside hydrolase family 5 protein [Candidatus Hydrogenedens sp.]